MEKELKNILPIMGIEDDCILSKQGDVTVVFKASLPEIFTLSDEDYETLHQAWVKAIRVLPKDTVLHKQDWFMEKQYRPENGKTAPGFLKQAADRYFSGRPYRQHDCYILLTKKPAGRKPSSSLLSNLLRPNLAPQDTLKPQSLRNFLDLAGQFQRLLEDSRLIKLQRVNAGGLQSQVSKSGLIERYCYLSEREEQLLYRDIRFEEGVQIGERKAVIYTLGDAENLPGLCGSRMTYDAYSTDKTKFPVSFAANLGLLLPCNHIYNQYILVGDAQATLKQLEKKRLRLQSLSAYSRENAISLAATNDFLNEAISQGRLPVKAHFNVMAWSDDTEELKDIKNQVASALAGMDAAAKPETAGAAQIWWAGIPGNAADFPVNDTFDTFAEQACCFLNLESNYKSAKPEEGIRFCDRSGTPVFIDLFDGPRTQGISSNMGVLVCGTSGGGKSMTVNHILRSLYDQGAHCVTVDIGGSYLGLCELVKGYYFTYTEENPIRFNPFYIKAGESLDTEKKESLKALLVALWKQEDEAYYRSEYVALSNALQGYYRQLAKDTAIFPCFNTFYEYLQNHYGEILKDQRVKDRDFNLDNFLYVLGPFYRGGEFDYLLNATENLNLLDQPFIVIELDNIKDHPILFPVVTLIIMELFISKMRKLQGVRKVLTIDEAWKAIAKSGMAEFLKYAFKTIRKFNGIPIVITQELEDLISSPIIKDAIINNADIKILMDMRKFQGKIEKLQDVLGMNEKGKTILLSVNKDNREIFIDIGGQLLKVFKNELCPEEYYAYTTEGKERVKVRQLAEQYGSLEKGIEMLVKEKQSTLK
ncbi:TraG family conjugative transposon ATPase [Mucilaginibacter sp. L3T2-6]|uniref:TraG family conjugative transposon ATPase n=1 Tax=Mucilaginibacter sp. L3T2-6 TaxID=3062491 RepID=UPI002675743F|nr:TraG family conjugative transposon ATPase [Mucilaginibacter sp. L3T2-6]MDO3641239.1 TraG family conjugative transposon ATPase [Mucilaginibacter sp. L3T2-6]MDV6214002.1 TraG family conjugative transposon ATPase [Mucilaginibacter sp. L3T2-6]